MDVCAAGACEMNFTDFAKMLACCFSCCHMCYCLLLRNLSTEKKTTLHTFKNKYNSDVASIVALTVAAAYLFWLPSSSRLQFLSSCRCCCLLVLTVVFTEAVIVTVN